jgi:hypothetical protein
LWFVAIPTVDGGAGPLQGSASFQRFEDISSPVRVVLPRTIGGRAGVVIATGPMRRPPYAWGGA